MSAPFALNAMADGSQSHVSSETAKRLTGMWRLVSVVDPKGQFVPGRGAHPTGFLVYDASGNMSLHIVPDAQLRRKFAGPQATLEEAKAAMTGYTGYFGAWTVDEKAQAVTHHLMGSINPGVVGNENVRKIELGAGDRLTLIPIESGDRLTWERVK